MQPSSSIPTVAGGLPPSPAPAAEIRACWSEIGVYGNATCTELQRVVHCRNCPTYSTAGAQLLNRPLPQEYRREWTEHFTAKRDLSELGDISAVIFRLASEWLALPTQVFQEVAERRQIHSLPHRQRTIALGLANVRGELLLCVSLARLLGLEAAPPEPQRRPSQRLLVIKWDGQSLAFPVDQVHGPQRFLQRAARPTPATLVKSSRACIQSLFFWHDRTVGLLETDALFSALNRSLV